MKSTGGSHTLMHRKGGVLTPGRFVARLFCIPKLHRAAARSLVHLTTPPESFFLPLRRKRGYPPPPPLRPVVVDLSLPLLASQPQLVTRIVCTSLLLPPSLLCDRFFSVPSAASQMTDTWLRGRAADGWPAALVKKFVLGVVSPCPPLVRPNVRGAPIDQAHLSSLQ